jgi:general secretion pathway protein C
VYKRDSKILGLGDELNGFVLEGGGSTYAIFTKDSKNYRVDLLQDKKSGISSGSIVPASALPKREAKPAAPLAIEGEVTDAGDHKIIDKSLLNHYAQNMDDIYKNIGITEIKEGDKMKFKITFVRRGSPFAKLGVRRGDMIKSINGQEINSYNAAFEAYKNIGNVENVTLVIQRGKEEMELEYEIN